MTELFNVESKPTASLRTKNRVRDNGSIFHMHKMKLVDGFDGVAVLLRSEKTEWLGWLPMMEIVLKKL